MRDIIMTLFSTHNSEQWYSFLNTVCSCFCGRNWSPQGKPHHIGNPQTYMLARASKAQELLNFSHRESWTATWLLDTVPEFTFITSWDEYFLLYGVQIEVSLIYFIQVFACTIFNPMGYLTDDKSRGAIIARIII